MQSHSMSGESTKPYILKKCIALLLSCGSSIYKFKQVHAFSIRRGVPLSSPEMGQENSGFVLSSPNIESHLITSVGEYYYCALAKGPLLPDHVLIMPIEHTPNALSRPLECEKELERLQSCLKAYFKKQGKKQFSLSGYLYEEVIPIFRMKTSVADTV